MSDMFGLIGIYFFAGISMGYVIFGGEKKDKRYYFKIIQPQNHPRTKEQSTTRVSPGVSRAIHESKKNLDKLEKWISPKTDRSTVQKILEKV